MKVIDGKRIMYGSDEEFYARQVQGAAPHDNNRIVKDRIAEALRFLMFGGRLDYTQPPVERADPNFASDIRILDVGCEDGWYLTYLKTGCPDDFTLFPPKKRFANTFGIKLIHKIVEYAKKKDAKNMNTRWLQEGSNKSTVQK